MTTGTRPPLRLAHVAVTAAIVVAGAGLLTGARTPAEIVRAEPRHPRGSGTKAVPRQADLGRERRGPHASMYAEAFDALAERLPRLDAPLPPVTAADRARALRERAERRAYEGAPPTIPHLVAEDAATDCLACHERGALIAGRIAPAMAHERYGSCLQCHAPAVRGAPFGEPPPVAGTTFAGLEAPGRGTRAWAGAPPTIPHRLEMRSNCASCHGPSGRAPLRTPHATRQSCLQCHAQDAAAQARNHVEVEER